MILEPMVLRNKIPILLIAFFTYNIFVTSCANIGSPTGGPRDSIPPFLIETSPVAKALNFKGKDIKLTFNEFIVSDKVSEELVISPPLSKKPTVRTKMKTLIIQFNEDLEENVTYSLDFKNSVVDLNENNPYKNLRFSFSTGLKYDSLRIAGKVVNAFNLNPVEGNLVMLYSDLNDTAVYRKKPNYIARTDKQGEFVIDNISRRNYRLYSVKDNNNNLKYDRGAEEIAFYDSLVSPSFIKLEKPDSLLHGLDSSLVSGLTRFLPSPLYMRSFTEKVYEQFLSTTARNKRNQLIVAFHETVKDTFGINLIGKMPKNWYIKEYNPEYDSLVFWITDSLVYKTDSLLAEITYSQLDSLNKKFIKRDTIDFNFVEKEDVSKQKKKKRTEEKDTIKKVVQYEWLVLPATQDLDLNDTIYFTSPEPVKKLDSTKIHLYLVEDSIRKPVKFEFRKDPREWRRYQIWSKWTPESEYVLRIDSTAATNVYEITSKKFERAFKSRAEDWYGIIELKLSNVTQPMIFQLLKNSDTEEILAEKRTGKTAKQVVFDFLPPEKYRIKIIYDTNGNGTWDTGNLEEKIQPERVSYINEVIKLRSNWQPILELNLNPDPKFTKSIRDKEVEEQKRKEALELKKKEMKTRQNPGVKPGNSDPGSFMRGMGNR